MMTTQTVRRVLEEASARGADFAEIYLEDGENNNISMTSGRIENALSGRSVGAGVRVIKGLQYVYVYTNDVTEQGLLRAARQAAAALPEAQAKGCDLVMRAEVMPQNSPVRISPAQAAIARKTDVVRAAYAAAADYDACIAQVRVNYIEWNKRVQVANTTGLFREDARTYTRLATMAVAAEGAQTQTGFEGPGAQMGFEFFDTVDVTRTAQDAAKTAVQLLRADLCPSGKMPVVIGNGFGGVIFHEACGHPLEAAFTSKGESVFAGKLGQSIAAPCVSAVDDGTLPNAWGSSNMDDEGHPTQRNVLIENGVLKTYLVDYLSGLRMGSASNGAGRRQSYAYAPTSRMSNTFIMPGNDTQEEMIATMGDGLYCCKMSGGSVNVQTSEFNFAVSEAYLVRGGKIYRPVRGATLIGKGSEILPRIDRVGSDLALAQGMCGAASGSIPTNVGQPTIRVSEITVGGQKGE